jgi:glycosyltransferase involved in cell wall biosynthesis
MAGQQPLRTAIVHYWLTDMRGGEKVLEQICRLHPTADIFTHVLDPDAISPALRRHRILTTFIDGLPFARRHYPKYLALMPLALEQLDLTDYELVISSEAGPAKGVLVDPEAVHVCYCHSPMRYIWNMYPTYRGQLGWLGRMTMTPLAHYLRMWDVTTSLRVDQFIANSVTVARRVERFYGRSASVIYPPVDIDSFEVSRGHDGYYLLLGQLVAYKRADLAVRAFNASGRRLVVIGGGEQFHRIRRLAGSNVTVLGAQSPETMREYLARCRALIFPGEEDFGIVPVEAMASGKPIIAYGRGGAIETVIDGRSGLFFQQQTEAALNEAVDRFEADFVTNPDDIAASVQRFAAPRFRERFTAAIERAVAAKHQGRPRQPARVAPRLGQGQARSTP